MDVDAVLGGLAVRTAAGTVVAVGHLHSLLLVKKELILAKSGQNGTSRSHFERPTIAYIDRFVKCAYTANT